VVEDPVFRQRFEFRRTTDPDGTEVLHIDAWVDPGGGVTPHLHPAMEERFTVIEGRPSFLSGRKWQPAEPGDTVVVPAGVRHAYRNRGDETARIQTEVRPPSSLQEMLEEVAELSRAGKLTRQGLPKRPSAVLDAAILVERHRDMLTLLFPPMPPPFVQRLLFPPLARLAERLNARRRRRSAGETSPSPPP
jgi:quercetin dioxygenase-like cupin family protein